MIEISQLRNLVVCPGQGWGLCANILTSLLLLLNKDLQGGDNIEEDLDLDEQEQNLLREYCKKAMERSHNITTGGRGYTVYNSQTEPEKRKVAESLEDKGYITGPKGYGLSGPVRRNLTREGVEYCNKLKKML